MKYHLTPIRMAAINKSTSSSAIEDVEKEENFCIVGGNADSCSHCGKQYGEIPQKIKNGSSSRPSNPPSGNISEGIQNTNLKEHNHPYVHFSVIYNHQDILKQPKCPSVDEWIKQLWDIYTMELYSPVKKKKILPSATV